MSFRHWNHDHSLFVAAATATMPSMAARKKAKKSRPKKSAKKARPKAGGKAKKKAGKSKPAKRKGKGKRGTEVERRWSTYLDQRSGLEEAVEAVRVAQESLAEAREEERKVRGAFDSAKEALEQLLEVEPAASARSQSRPLGDVPVLSLKDSKGTPKLG